MLSVLPVCGLSINRSISNIVNVLSKAASSVYYMVPETKKHNEKVTKNR